MKRHPSLHALSEHHHHALVRALEIRRAAQGPARARAQAVRAAAQTFLRFWKKTGREHFRQEEEVLLPAFARHVALDQDAAVMRMLAQHAVIRGLVEDLAAALAQKRPVEKTMTRLGQLLHDHVRLEENEIFPRIEATLGQAELQTLGHQLPRMHKKS